MSIEQSIEKLADSQNNLAAAMNNYASVMQGIAAGNPTAIVAPSTGEGTAAAADTGKATGGKRGPKPKAEPAPAEADPFADDAGEEAGEPELTAETIRKVVLAVKEKNKDHALGLLKKVGADTIAKIDAKDYQKVVDLAAKVGVTLDDIE